MRLQETEKILNKHFPNNFKKLDESGVFRCIRKFKEDPYQVLYVDCKEEWTEKGFDLEKYQEKYLLNDFYENSGYLQWSNYFIFLGQRDKINNSKDLKKEIEGNDIYTRKYVMPAEDFDDWLIRTQNVTKNIKGEIQEDLSSKWMEILRDSKLDCVFLKDENYKDGLERFLKGDPVIEEDHNGKNNDEDFDEHITSILELKLNDFRSFPVKKKYSFGKVNLIKGVNGTGKTSLLEAIELLLCGKTYRNPNENYSEYNLSALFQGNNKYHIFNPKNISLYKKRDEHWYNNPYHSGSISTYLNFKKYNFFNSDAAFELSNDSSRFDIREAFEDIALGEMVNTIEIRMKKFLDRFQRELRSYQKDINGWKEELKDEEKIIKQINESDDNPEKFYNEFLSECRNNYWKVNEDLDRDQLLINFEKNYLKANQYISSIIEAVNWLESISLEIIADKRLEFQEASDWLDKVNKEIKASNQQIKKTRQELLSFQELQNDLGKLESYYEVIEVGQLLGLNEKIEITQSKIRKYSRIETQIEKANLKYLEEQSGLINTYEKQLTKELDEVSTDKGKLDDKIDRTREGLNLLQQIVTDIKSKGKEFIKEYPDAKECPLCHEEYKSSELKKNINKVNESFKQSEILEDLLVQQSTLTKKLKELEKERNNLSIIKSISNEFYEDSHLESSVDEFLKSVKKNSKDLKEAKQRKSKLESIKQKFNDKGLSEKDFKILQEKLEGGDNISIKNKDELDELVKNTRKKISDVNKIIGDLEIDEKGNRQKKEDKLSKLVIGGEVSEEVFNKQLKEFIKAEENFEELSKIIGFDKATELYKVKGIIDQLHEMFKKAKDLIKDQEQNEIRRKAANEKIQKLKKKIDLDKPKLERAEKAVSVIEDILENHSKSNFLKEFFQKNREEILDIFKLIHSPKEFVDLKFDEKDNNTLKLVRDITGELATLNKISSGQRSALALSIFLALNKKLENGPEIILFDDPVTTIDDLNTLSFLDYLRELSINSNRQIFFATANEDLAYLFKKKFEFLGDDSFKEFQLQRI